MDRQQAESLHLHFVLRFILLFARTTRLKQAILGMSSMAELDPAVSRGNKAGTSRPPGQAAAVASMGEESGDTPSTVKETPLLDAANMTTPEEFALLKTTYNQLSAARRAAEEKEDAAREKRKAQPGYDSVDDILSFMHDDTESWRLYKKISALRLPHPEPLQWALAELSADFKTAHIASSKLAKCKVAAGREWFDDDRRLVSEWATYLKVCLADSSSS